MSVVDNEVVDNEEQVTEGVEEHSEITTSDGQDTEGAEHEAGSISEEEGVGESEEVQGNLHRVTVDGQEQEVSLEELTRGYSHRAAAQKRFEEAARVRKEAESEMEEIGGFVESIKKAPLQTLMQIPGIKEQVQQDIHAYVAEHIRRQHLSEEELQTEELRENFAREKAEYEALIAQKQQTQAEMQATNFQKELGGWIEEQIPSFPTAEGRELFKINLKASLAGQGTPLTQEQVKKVAEDTQSFLGRLGPKSAEPEKKVTPPVPGSRSGNTGKTPPKKAKNVSMEDFFLNLRSGDGII